jgi:protein-disulfide isomerase
MAAKKPKQDNLLTGAIVFASVIIAGAIVFFGTQFGGGANLQSADFEERVNEIVDDYIVKLMNGEVTPGAGERDLSSGGPDDDAVLGDKNAPVTIVEFSDYECPFCKRFVDDTLPQIKAEYIDTGKVKLVYRDFPLSSHPNAIPAAMAAECFREQTDDEGYYQYHDMIFAGGAINRDKLVNYADQLGADVEEFGECVDSEKYLEEVQKDFEDGQKAGITGTPGFIINGETIISGARDYSEFQAAIEAALAQ